MEQDEAIVAPLFASAVMGLSVIDYNLQVAPSYVLDPLFPILGPLSTAELLPAGGRHRGPARTQEAIFRCFPNFFCDLERVAQWLHAFQLVGNTADGFRDEEWFDSIERQGFVCQGSELAGVTIEYRASH